MMARDFPHVLLDDPKALSEYDGWTEEVYADFLALQRGRVTVEDFDGKYLHRQAILNLDLTGFTISAIQMGSLPALLRIFDAQKVCIPVVREHGATFIRIFADDIVALFDSPATALDASLEIHARVHAFNRSDISGPNPPEASIGIGYGDVYAVGPNRAMGAEMNRTSKLGEDTACGGEILVTESVHAELKHRNDVTFEPERSKELPFSFYRVTLDR
jgi:class 3 adenylate cyclase